MNPIMRKLAKTTNALDAIRQGLIHCGFELEFHAMDGASRDDLTDGDSYCVGTPNTELTDDSSVDGAEIRTVGALTPIQFMAAITELFNEHTFQIDTGCSFHIHLSVPGIFHQYGHAIQAEMMGYLLENQHRLPESVRARLKSDSINYFEFRNSADKYRAVSRHRQGTWEFRLFGNITNRHDAWRCLLMAIDTMRHAYQVRCKMAKSIISIDEALAMGEISKIALKNDRSLKQQIRYDKLFKNAKQSA